MSLGAYNAQSKSLVSRFESSSSFSFDGTDDFIVSDANQTLATQTFSFWLKNSDTSERQTIFTHGLHYIGAFHINWDLSEDHGPIIYFDSGSYKIFSDAACPQQDDGQWHHYLVAVDSAAVENSRLWIDSVEITSVVSTNTGAGGAFNSGIRFGKSADQTWYYGGSIDEFAIFSGLQTDTDFIRRIYNDGRPTNLITEDNLAHWFRFGEGRREDKSDGDSNILFQGMTKILRSELVTNGDFSDNSVPDTWNGSAAVNLAGWTSGGATFTADAHFVITDGACRLISDGTNTVINSGTTVAGRTYRYSIDLTDVTSGGLTLIGGGVVLEANATSPGTYTGFYTATSATSAISINRQSGATDFTFDNVSVKEVNGQFVGNELVTNTDFSSASGWNLDTNASVSGGKLVLTGSSGISYVTLDLDDGHAYEVSFTVENLTSGTVKPYLNGTNGTVRSANGTYTEIVIAGSSNTIVGINPSGTMEIDNFSLKKLEQSGRISGPTVIPDVGAQLMTGFTNGSSYPFNTFTSSGNNITAAVETSGNWAGAASNQISIVNGTTYKVTFNLDYTSGTDTLRVVLADNANGAATQRSNAYYTTSDGVNVAYLTATATDTTAHLQIGTWHETDVINFSATHITLQEVTNGVPLQTQNLAPISRSEKSLDFDGTDDFTDTGFQPDFIHLAATMAYWVNMDDLTDAQLCGIHSAKRFYLGFYNATAGMGVQGANNLGSGTDLSSFMAVDQWHHIAVVAEGGTATYYLDGVARDTMSYTQNIADNPNANLNIGAVHNSGSAQDFMNASISDFAVWDAALSASAVEALYNAGQSCHLTVNTGAYTYRDNLQYYSKSGSATVPAADGTSNLLFDQTSPGVGAEQITNGSFSTDSNWTKGTGWTISGGVASIDGSQSGGVFLYQNAGLVNNKYYKVTFDVVSRSAGQVRVQVGGSSPGTYRSSTGTFTEYIKAFNSIVFYVQADSSFNGSIDNVSVKEVNGHTGTISGATIQTEAPKAIMALPPVANTKSLNFDGTNDHLVTQVDDTLQPNGESRYYSFWLKSTTTARYAVFDHGTHQTGALQFNDGNKPVLMMGTSVYQLWNDNSAQDDGEFHHWLVKLVANSLSDCELWCDGVKQTKSTTVNTGSMNVYTTGIRIARSGSFYLNGNIDEFCIWGELSNPDEFARALYNAGRPIDPSKSLGAANQPELLEHWWRMGDASLDGNADGTNDILFQGFSEEGSELVPNADLSTWSDADTIATWTHKDTNNNSGGGVISQVGSGEGKGGTGLGSANYFTASGTTMHLTSGTISEAGRTYRLEIEVSRYVQGIIRVQGAVAQDFGASDIVDGKIVKIFTATSATYIRVQGSNACDFTVDNVSLKQVRGQYIGAEEITNGDFSSSSNWTLTGTAEITGGVANWPDATNSTIYQNANINLAGIHAYRLEYDVVTTNGSSGLRLDGGSSAFATTSIPSDTVGRKTVYIVSNGSQAYLMINNSGAFVGSIDNVSLKPVGGAAVLTNMDPGSDIVTDTPY